MHSLLLGAPETSKGDLSMIEAGKYLTPEERDSMEEHLLRERVVDTQVQAAVISRAVSDWIRAGCE